MAEYFFELLTEEIPAWMLDSALATLRERLTTVATELGGTAAAVRAVDIHTFEACYNIIGKYPEAWAPKTRETADHSLPYCTAAALMDGDVTLAPFDEARFPDEPLLALTAKVQVHLDDALTARYPKGIPNRITVTLNDGRKLVREVEFPRGHAGNPMTDQEVEAKFRLAVEPRYGKAKVDEVLGRCWELERLTSVTELIGLFS